jgi:cytochrome bd-type quinol oxidase subunit 2
MMLIGLTLRGVAFDFRIKARAAQPAVEPAFFGSRCCQLGGATCSAR